MKTIRPIIDEMVKTATDLNVHEIEYEDGIVILFEKYYELKNALKEAYKQCDWDTEDLKRNWFSKLFDNLMNDDFLTYNGLSKFIKLLFNIYMCYTMANFVDIMFVGTDAEDTNNETDNGR